MTTIIYANGILAADTRATVTNVNIFEGVRYTWYCKIQKIRVTPFFATVGAGSSFLYCIIKFLPFFLFMRIFGFVIFPYFGRKNSIKGAQNLTIFWKYGSVWIFDIECIHKGPFIFAKVKHKTIVEDKNKNKLSFACGSGSDYVDLEEAKNLGAREMILEVSKVDDYTNDEVVSFDTTNWNYTNEVADLPRQSFFWQSMLGFPYYDTSFMIPARKEKV